MNWLHKQFSDIDISALRFIHNNRIKQLDDFLYYFSFVTTFVSISILTIVLFLAVKNKSSALRMNFFKLLSVLVLSAIISTSLKYFFERSRPFETYPDIEKLSEGGGSSFPSGHTIEAFSVAFTISALFRKRKYVVLIYLWALLIAYSRMALGVHYPFDVIGGILTGSLVSFFTLKLFDLKMWKEAK